MKKHITKILYGIYGLLILCMITVLCVIIHKTKQLDKKIAEINTEATEIVLRNTDTDAMDNTEEIVISSETISGNTSALMAEAKSNEKGVKSSFDGLENELTIPKLEVDGHEVLKKCKLDMENIKQYPELPTGCEAVSLTMVLKYYGYDDITKFTIVDDYLEYSDNFIIGYSGSPYTSSGGGIFPPGLVRSANNFLNDKRSLLNARDVSDSAPGRLYKFINEGVPVIIWDTVNMYDNSPEGGSREYKGKQYHWDRCEHCVVLMGYDIERNIVIINDPIDGIVERDAERFWKLYENLGSMAMVVK